ncbi:MAG: hypothetical protein HC767_07345 [Akkermansiaceae bacterium]|nr:hypothetical protein [Akkermansiaceae bacterium]
MELSMEARGLCAEYLDAAEQRPRARDVLHLDIVLTGTVRTIIEANLECWLALLKEALSEGVPCGFNPLPLFKLFVGMEPAC